MCNLLFYYKGSYNFFIIIENTLYIIKIFSIAHPQKTRIPALLPHCCMFLYGKADSRGHCVNLRDWVYMTVGFCVFPCSFWSQTDSNYPCSTRSPFSAFLPSSRPLRLPLSDSDSDSERACYWSGNVDQTLLCDES